MLNAGNRWLATFAYNLQVLDRASECDGEDTLEK